MAMVCGLDLHRRQSTFARVLRASSLYSSAAPSSVAARRSRSWSADTGPSCTTTPTSWALGDGPGDVGWPYGGADWVPVLVGEPEARDEVAAVPHCLLDEGGVDVRDA
jgi:hypothetical protein